MPINRFYIDSPLEKGAIYFLPQEEIKHLKVMRIKEGDLIEVINGKNILAQGKIKSISKKNTEIELISLEEKTPPKQKLILIQSYTKPPKLELILEKGCELGVSTFILFPSKRAEKVFSTKEKRYHTILISSTKQCGRLDLPEIIFEKKIPPLPNTHLFYGDLRENTPFFPDAINLLPPNQSIGFINGPESGFTPDEILHFEKDLKVKGVSLHPNVLRAETAAISALTLCQIYLKKT